MSESRSGREYTAMIWRLDGWEPIGCAASLLQARDDLAAWKRDLPGAHYAIGFRDVPDWTVPEIDDL